MKNKYIDFINQTFDFPQPEFKLEGEELLVHDIPMMDLVREHGTPLKFCYLPKIGENIKRSRNWFANAFEQYQYSGKYYYAYCTKSSHFSFVLDQCLKHNTQLETSSAFDLDLIGRLLRKGKLNKDIYILCNGYKNEEYIRKMNELIELGCTNVIPIIDSVEELDWLDKAISSKVQIGIRIASEEEPKFAFYTSRLGIGYKDIVPLFLNRIKDHPKFELKMLHFFVNTGIRDTGYYWNELRKSVKLYVNLKKYCDSLNSINIGGGFPVKNSLRFDFDYQGIVTEIIRQIQEEVKDAGVVEPNIFTEFGSFTVAESGGQIYNITSQKSQNDREKWNMINGSFITALPDAWAINSRFVLLPLNKWNSEYERVFLGGVTCDGDDYYNSEQHVNAIYLPKYEANNPLYIAFINTGAYQEALSGFGGIKHCLIPESKYILIDKDENGNISTSVFSERQTADSMLDTLGY